MTAPRDTLEEIAAALRPLTGRLVLDVGCGAGRLSAALTRRGAQVLALDPEAGAVAAAARAAPGALVLQGDATRLPVRDAALGGAVFLNSLHHVPEDRMGLALMEATRVLAPGAPLVVVEPLAAGTFFEAMRPLEDETLIRAAAQEAIQAALQEGRLRLVRTLDYERLERFPDLDTFLERLVTAEPARAAAVPASREAVAARFEALGESGEGGVLLRQPLRMHVLAGG